MDDNIPAKTVQIIPRDIDRNLTEHYSLGIPDRVEQQHCSGDLLAETTAARHKCLVSDSRGGSIFIPNVPARLHPSMGVTQPAATPTIVPAAAL